MYRSTYKLICAWKTLYSLSGMYDTELTMPRLRMRGTMFARRGVVLNEAKEQH
jgi:hypothetical protein